ncbi:hypothetical protein GYM62_12905 [Algoriphagus sp. NBT04N3]|uniref:BF3164 family lipoprotein n=1 Tax=Algoriphagus sp. NBT04N3 TaxID=2705473 RepID=UPI001C626CAB|nr:BF3164 family lipoprotein [Algoriphagus sp. NBT04N3]QYH39638.1 hypothetical protein GYM62_12905 [Algoriphagus sp. NBT04N3]
MEIDYLKKIVKHYNFMKGDKIFFLYFSFVTLLTGLIFSCDESRDRQLDITTSVVERKDFSKSVELNGISQKIDSVFLPASILIHDNYLVLTDKAGSKSIHIYEIERNKLLYKGGYIGKGGGPEELILPWKIFNADDRNIGVYDPELKKILKIDIDSLVRFKNGITSLSFNPITYGVSIYGSDLVYFNPIDPTARLFRSTIGKSETIKYGKLSTPGKSWGKLDSDFETNYKFHYARLESFSDVFLVSYYRIPFFEIYDLRKGTRISLEIFDDLPPIERFNRGTYISSSQVTENFIYILYMNGLTDAKPRNNEIFVFDHKGNPVNKLVLDQDIFEFRVFEEKELFVLASEINGKDFDLIRYKLENSLKSSF